MSLIVGARLRVQDIQAGVIPDSPALPAGIPVGKEPAAVLGSAQVAVHLDAAGVGEDSELVAEAGGPGAHRPAPVFLSIPGANLGARSVLFASPDR
jgi:hypothetical protein